MKTGLITSNTFQNHDTGPGHPEQIARDKIDNMLSEAGWLVQSKDEVNLSAGKGVALRETKQVLTSSGLKTRV